MGCAKFIVKGKVQGVFYRKYISQAMNKRGFIGYVKNLKDGSVEVVVKIEPNQNISEILEILNEGSPKSEVETITMDLCNEDSIKFNNIFEVRY